MSEPDQPPAPTAPPCHHCGEDTLTFAGSGQAGDPPVWLNHWDCVPCGRKTYTIAGHDRTAAQPFP